MAEHRPDDQGNYTSNDDILKTEAVLKSQDSAIKRRESPDPGAHGDFSAEMPRARSTIGGKEMPAVPDSYKDFISSFYQLSPWLVKEEKSLEPGSRNHNSLLKHDLLLKQNLQMKLLYDETNWLKVSTCQRCMRTYAYKDQKV